MVSVISILNIICAFASVGLSDLPRYEHKAQITSDFVMPSPTAVKSNPLNNDKYSLNVEINVNFKAQLYFNSANDYVLDNFEFTISSAVYEVDYSNDEYNYVDTFDDYKYLELQVTKTNFLDYFNFDILTYYDSGEYDVELYANGESVFYNDHAISVSYVYYTESELRIRGEYLYNQIAQYINNYDNYGDISIEAYNNGYEVGYSSGFDVGKGEGYSEGFQKGTEVDDTAVTIFNGILNIALVPINFFLAIFNFEILGINISSLVSALLSICLVIIVVRFVTGKKQGGD